MSESKWETQRTNGDIEKHIVKQIKIPFFTFEKEYITDEDGKKTTIRREIHMVTDSKEIKRDAIISLVSCYSFKLICNGISSIIDSCKKKK